MSKLTPERYKDIWFDMMRNKLGITGRDSKDQDLFLELLSWMHQNKVDYTNTFCHLMNELKKDNTIYENQEFVRWEKKLKERRKINNNSPENSNKLMRDSNPLVIPRNHKVEEALKEAENNNDLTSVKKLVEALKTPYKKVSNISIYQSPPETTNVKYKTYCGT